MKGTLRAGRSGFPTGHYQVKDRDIASADNDISIGDNDISIGDNDISSGDNDISIGDNDIAGSDNDISSSDNDISIGDNVSLSMGLPPVEIECSRYSLPGFVRHAHAPRKY